MTVNDKDRIKTRIATYLVGTRDNTVLLGKRKNTPHMNGLWSLFAGHVQEGKSIFDELAREMKEECGIELKKSDVTLIGSVYHPADDFDYVDFIFYADLTQYNPTICEPHKCDGMEFFPLNSLPEPMDEYIKLLITKSTEEKTPFIFEYGCNQ